MQSIKKDEGWTPTEKEMAEMATQLEHEWLDFKGKEIVNEIKFGKGQMIWVNKGKA